MMTFYRSVLRSNLSLASLALASGCGPAMDAAPPGSAAAWESPGVETGSCDSAPSCANEAKRAAEAGDTARLQMFLGYGCDQGDGGACLSRGLALDAVNPKAEELFKKACTLGDAAGCFNAAERVRHQDLPAAIALYKKSCESGAPLERSAPRMACERGSLVAYTAHDFDSAKALAQHVCDTDAQSGCGLLGVMAAKGEGSLPDAAEAAQLLLRGCKAGDEEACENAKKLAREEDKPQSTSGELDVAGANLSMGSVTANGFTMRDLACKTENGGIGAVMLGPGLAAAIAAKKAQLRACSPKGGEARVRFKMEGGHTSQVEAKAATPAIEACVVKVMKTVVAPTAGTCAATLALASK